MKKIAFVTGMTGQDGPYLAQHLLQHDYKVYGLVKRYSNPNLSNLNYLGIENDVELITGDITDDANMNHLIRTLKPNEFYNLAAQSFVQTSFDQPIYTSEIDAIGVTRILEIIRLLGGKIKFYQASTSEMFGKVQSSPQNEETAFYPRSPYGVSKLYGHWMTINYREAWNLHACSGILFNHESPLRGIEFVTRKITLGVAEIAKKKKKSISLGNLNAERDWGFAGDYVNAMWLMLQKKDPCDYVIATGETHSVRDFVEKAFKVIDTEIEWVIDNEIESGRCKKSGNILIDINKNHNRPSETDYLLGDAAKAKEELNWKPKVNFNGLIEMMVMKDLYRVENNVYSF